MLRFIKTDDSLCRTDQHNAAYSLLYDGIWQEYGVRISEKDIARGELGKPYLKCYPHIHFSISHCSGLAACLIADVPCGVDCEPVRNARDTVAQRVFSQSEFNRYMSLTERERDIYFTALWTLKEAYAKADGRGISVMKQGESEIRDGVFSSVSGMYCRTFTDDEFILSVCVAERIRINTEFGCELNIHKILDKSKK